MDIISTDINSNINTPINSTNLTNSPLIETTNINNPFTFKFNLDLNWHSLPPYEFWSKLGNPKYVCAPMVAQSELAFRTLVRKYGCDLTFTPMIHSVVFATHKKLRDEWLNDISNNEQPCFVQFAGNDPEMLLQAGKYIEGKSPCFDINLGCPQGIARKGHYGSFLLEDEDLVLKIAGYLSNNLKCGVSCKIRLFPDINRTLTLVKNLEERGIKVLTVHGRTKEQNKLLVGECDWSAIRKIKEVMSIPVIANGGVENFEDLDKCFEISKCDAYMSAEKLLEVPFLFSKKMYDLDEIGLEFIDLSRKFNSDIDDCRSHLFKFYYQAGQMNLNYNDRLSKSKTYDELWELGKEIQDFWKENNVRSEDKLGWYNRYRWTMKDRFESENKNKDDGGYEYDMSNLF